MKYTAINIGPIVGTLSMARKPRELWAASYLFSYLMSFIFKKIEETNDIEIFSPAKPSAEKIGVGLYPDRVYCTGTWDFPAKREEILEEFAQNLGLEEDEDFKSYFNIMCVSVEVEKTGNYETAAIRKMNHLLDCLELYNRPQTEKSQEAIINVITRKYGSPLFTKAFQEGKFHIKTIAEYASVQLDSIDSKLRGEAKKVAKIEEELKTNFSDEYLEVMEDAYYRKLKESSPKDFKSFHKYICVVQADGDNMGATFSHEALSNGETTSISTALVNFGREASKKIVEYGGLPIYAGGDDLLFIAPVVSNISTDEGVPKNIFHLLREIDGCFGKVQEKVKLVAPSMSYGISISYYKFPLYEALESARNLLFDVAKGKVDGKNAVAWRLQKHSGSSFSGAFSKTDLLSDFEEVVRQSQVKDTVVSAVSHKIRESQMLLQLWLAAGETAYQQRNRNFFEKYLDYAGTVDAYKTSVLKLLNKIYEVYQPILKEKDEKIESDREINIDLADKARGILTIEQKKEQLKEALRDDLFNMIYSMLRTAKFINGEEAIDE